MSHCESSFESIQKTQIQALFRMWPIFSLSWAFSIPHRFHLTARYALIRIQFRPYLATQLTFMHISRKSKYWGFKRKYWCVDSCLVWLNPKKNRTCYIKYLYDLFCLVKISRQKVIGIFLKTKDKPKKNIVIHIF